ncbi:vacuolar aminopeptidase 1 [Elasticomyces elasticus]|nr:vacuolar aminopeptidase 1 [Elasticomyces elasticus]KAK4929791.1 vacuolar aminopeptidase 1 [Elasticomyces elasticus]
MVKNTDSMQSLDDSMTDLNVSAPPNTQPRMLNQHYQAPQTTQQLPVRLNQPTQLVGIDNHTKLLMNRIATGAATAEERAAWQEHVAAVKARTQSAHDMQRLQWEQQQARVLPQYQQHMAAMHPRSNPIGFSGPMPSSPIQNVSPDSGSNLGPMSKVWMPSVPPSDAQVEHGRQDYELQLRLLEQQNRKRLSMAREEQERIAAPKVDRQGHEAYHAQFKKEAARKHNAEQQQKEQLRMHQEYQRGMNEMSDNLEYQAEQGNLYASDQPAKSNPALEDYQMQLHLLDQSNKKRFATARAEQTHLSRQATPANAAKYTEPFCKFLTDNPTVFHAVSAIKKQLKDAGFSELSERDGWDLKTGGSYFVERNGSSLIAFTVGGSYKTGNGAAILAGHVDALTAKLKPISQVPNKAGYLQLGVAPYAGAPNSTWWDRDLGIGGRVLIKEGDKIVSKLVKLGWPIARIPTLAPHFGAAAVGPFNAETQMVPIIGLDSSESSSEERVEPFSQPSILGGGDNASTFVSTQPPRLVKAIGNELGLSASTYSNIVNWELELFDVQPATVGGLDKEFIFAGQVLGRTHRFQAIMLTFVHWAAIQALIETKDDAGDSSQLQVVGLFDDEEIGSGLRQGARSNFLPTVLERAVGALADHKLASDVMGRTYANSFLVSSDVTHAVNPNFLGAYLENHAPHLNVGVVVSADSNGHMTTDSVSTAILQRCAEKVGAKLQVFQIRNDSRSGGTVGPMLSSMTGIRAVDAGIPQLSMHSIRATTGSLDPGLGVKMFVGFLSGFEEVDSEFRG